MKNETIELKIPPHSVDAEQAVLGGLMLDSSVWDKVVDVLSESDFYRDDHRLIFSHIMKMIDLSRPIDLVTVSESLERSDHLEHVGGVAYLAAVTKNTPSAANIRHYAEIVRDRAILRRLITLSSEIAELAFHPRGRVASDILDESERKIFEIAERGGKGFTGFTDIQVVLDEVMERLQEIQESGPSNITGVPAGYADLDEMTSGFQPGDLIIIAGRPSMGKTAFSLNIAEYVAVQQMLPVGIFSMEMSNTQLAMRMISSMSRLNQRKVRNAQLTNDEWERLVTSFGLLKDAPIYIDESAALNSYEVRARVRRLHRHYGGKLGLVIVDYLQLMSSTGSQSDTRATAVSEISRSLKALAKEVNCPVIALSQLSRRVEERGDKRPQMNDLRESGAIEQDADLILMLYRDEYYNRDSREKGVCEVIIGKQRNGPVGTVRLHFSGDITRFENLAPVHAY
ncbi:MULTISPECIES: replicative DNA helicase [Candidatus Ichthyocystis]|uniref:Replicative DNA helicase n=1 Tax=Candidatus Ichthyocystis hellenicum TaxID=1561003 RepID=A0A0S4M2I7_9BURK|nr:MULTISPECIES: replicative DNA helicase [Ichthyocystis]CUT17902.1 Replicative DNA helicase [Candidatus Ichthyocystis hellenicum]